MAVEIQAARLLVYNAARLQQAGRAFVKEAAMAKLYSAGGSGLRGGFVSNTRASFAMCISAHIALSDVFIQFFK